MSYAALEMLNARLEALYYLADAADFIELDLQLVDFAEDSAEAGDFGVSIVDCVGGAAGLQGRGGLRLLVELRGGRVSQRCFRLGGAGRWEQEWEEGRGITYIVPALLDRVHETVKVGAERLEACGIQEEAALARGMGRGARRGAALLAEGNLLVLAEELDFALREAQLVVGDRGGHHTLLILTPWSWSNVGHTTMHGTPESNQVESKAETRTEDTAM